MSVLINNMEMPKEGSWKTVRIYPDGTCAVPNWQGDRTLIKGAKAVPVPPHGDLIDRRKLPLAYIDITDLPAGRCLPVYLQEDVDDAPTIIPVCEEVYDKYTDTAGNLHWTGTHSGKHIVKVEEGEK